MKERKHSLFQTIIFLFFLSSIQKILASSTNQQQQQPEQKPTTKTTTTTTTTTTTKLRNKWAIEPMTIEECNGIEPGKDNCYYRIIFEENSCTIQNKCDHLLVYWSGGEQNIMSGHYDSLMKFWAKNDYVAVVAQPFASSKSAGEYPLAAEADRLSFITKTIRENVSSIWTGSKLVVGGVSHGASALPASLALKSLFQTAPEVWLGQNGTGVVLFDGISNTATWEEWLYDQYEAGLDVDHLCYNLHYRTVNRYGDGGPLTHSCTNHKCYCSNPKDAIFWMNDTTVIGSEYPPSPYQCENFQANDTKHYPPILYRYIACEGERRSPCDAYGDLVPTPQQELPYQQLSLCDGVITSFQELPNCGHSLCGARSCGAEAAIDWINEQWS